ncbi:unnamed protein product, partial [Mesorhabditis belari]|uniref:Uncharacterized protein n=1 Tax=Mesorhabditis belari TaxID=2138241 RepID=A0AAF3F597_9BILA
MSGSASSLPSKQTKQSRARAASSQATPTQDDEATARFPTSRRGRENNVNSSSKPVEEVASTSKQSDGPILFVFDYPVRPFPACPRCAQVIAKPPTYQRDLDLDKHLKLRDAMQKINLKCHQLFDSTKAIKAHQLKSRHYYPEAILSYYPERHHGTKQMADSPINTVTTTDLSWLWFPPHPTSPPEYPPLDLAHKLGYGLPQLFAALMGFPINAGMLIVALRHTTDLQNTFFYYVLAQLCVLNLIQMISHTMAAVVTLVADDGPPFSILTIATGYAACFASDLLRGVIALHRMILVAFPYTSKNVPRAFYLLILFCDFFLFLFVTVKDYIPNGAAYFSPHELLVTFCCSVCCFVGWEVVLPYADGSTPTGAVAINFVSQLLWVLQCSQEPGVLFIFNRSLRGELVGGKILLSQ